MSNLVLYADSCGDMFESELINATENLPPNVKRWISRAIGSEGFQIGPGEYDGRPEGGVCPVVAGAILAGV